MINLIYYVGIFIGIASALAGLIALLKEHKQNDTSRKRLIKIFGLVFLLSLIITGATFIKDKGSAQTKKAGLYIANGSNSQRIYFHNSAEQSTRRSAFIDSQVELYVREVKNGFGYVEFVNSRGESSFGWVEMSKLIFKGQ